MRDSQGEGKSDPAEGGRRHCMKILRFILHRLRIKEGQISCKGKRTKASVVSRSTNYISYDHQLVLTCNFVVFNVINSCG